MRWIELILLLQAYYTGQTQPVQHGGNSGSEAEIDLDPDEFITAIEGCPCADGSLIAQLAFTSNKSMYLPPD